MVKKIKRYAKFIVCVALIMGLIAPSYAALSASDGSAFVTKAEFDSALADFNARLTTFEAGINSKIDSQVTSYLDRNGIWNGAPQILETTSLEYGVQAGTQYTGEKNKWWNMFGKQQYVDSSAATTGARTGYSGLVSSTLNPMDIPTKLACLRIAELNPGVTTMKFIDKIGKAGLLFITLGSGTKSDGYNATCLTTQTGTLNLANVKTLYECSLTFFESDYNQPTKNRKDKTSLKLNWAGSSTGGFCSIPEFNTSSLLMFVSKNDSIYIERNEVVIENPKTNPGNDHCFLTFYRSDAHSKRTLLFTSASVY